MRFRYALVLWLALTALLRLVASEPVVLTAPEVDTLEAGVQLAEALTSDEESLRQRLRVGFSVDIDQARAALLPKNQPWRRAVVEPPLPKWLAALSVMLAPSSGSTPNMIRAATGAAAVLALAAVLLLAGLWRRDPVIAAVSAGGLLIQPGAIEAAGGAGYGAAAALAMVLLLLATERLCRRGRGGLAVGAAWGLALAVHPGALFLIIPVFVAFSVTRRAHPSEERRAHREGGSSANEPGAVPLPVAPLSLFLAPLVAFALLIALWPPLWEETGKRLGAWLMDNGWLFNPTYNIGGVLFDQAHGRAAMAWTPFVQWAGWLAPTLLIAFVAGVGRLARVGRAGLWFPLLAWLTLILVGGADGGLFGGRLSLMPLLWVPAAVLAAQGVRELAALVARWSRWSARAALGAVVTLALGAPWLMVIGGAPSEPSAETGALLLRPLPTTLLREIARKSPGARVRVVPDPEQWRGVIDVARDHLELPLVWDDSDAARWVVALSGASPGSGRGEPSWRGSVYGLPIEVFGPRESPLTAGSGRGASVAAPEWHPVGARSRPGPGPPPVPRAEGEEAALGRRSQAAGRGGAAGHVERSAAPPGAARAADPKPNPETGAGFGPRGRGRQPGKRPSR